MINVHPITMVYRRLVAKVSLVAWNYEFSLSLSLSPLSHLLLSECRVCPAAGQVCDPLSGECVCPPNTVGEMCENCAEDSWDYDPLKGCKKCECNQLGSDAHLCNVNNGQVQHTVHM